MTGETGEFYSGTTEEFSAGVDSCLLRIVRAQRIKKDLEYSTSYGT
jgi:hypothetical protein